MFDSAELTETGLSDPRKRRLLGRSVLVLTSEYGEFAWGGLATYLHSALPALLALGIRVHVVVAPTYARELSYHRRELAPIAPLAILDTHLGVHEQLAVLLASLDTHYDCVYVQDHSLVQLAIELRHRGCCRRMVAAAHLPSYSGFSYFDRPADDEKQQAAESLLFRHCDVVVVGSAFSADSLLRVHRLHPQDVRVVPFGSPKVAVRSEDENSSEPGSLRVLSVGRIARQKGLREFRDTVDRTPVDAAVFVHVGQEIRAQDRHVLAQSRIQMLGQRPHGTVLAELSRADILLSTSLHETFGLAVLEAMACGAVPVAFRCGALSELVRHGSNGMLVSIGDSDALARTLVELSDDRERLTQLRTEAIRDAAAYSWSAHAKTLAEALVAA